MNDIKKNINPRLQASFSLKNRVLRFLWGIVYVFLFKFTPSPFHRWRVFLLKLFGATLDKNVHVYPDVIIWAPWNLTMVAPSCLGPKVNCYNIAKVTIKKYAIVSQQAYLCTGTHDYIDPNFQLLAKEIVIEENAWVCARSFIGPGVTVGKDSIVGACAVLNKSIASNQIYAGNPAQYIKQRYGA